MCAVDAIQYLTGCTFGKGNLIHRDFGRTAFSFYDREREAGYRLILKSDARGEDHEELAVLMVKQREATISKEEQDRLAALRQAREQRIMSLPLEELFGTVELTSPPPRPARVLQSLQCSSCGENTMESRTRRFAGKTLCIPCFDEVEQKR